jgi:hypothetical protein
LIYYRSREFWGCALHSTCRSGGFGHSPNPRADAVLTAGGLATPAPDSRGLRLPIIFWFENHREHRGHREKWQRSVLSECSVVDYLYKYSFFLQRMRKTIIALPFTQKEISRLLPALSQGRCAQLEGLPCGNA